MAGGSRWTWDGGGDGAGWSGEGLQKEDPTVRGLASLIKEFCSLTSGFLFKSCVTLS